MIRLSGLTVATDDQPDGDIPIIYTGLRPGEKLTEELLISATTLATEHPRIGRAVEPFLPQNALQSKLAALRAAMSAGDRDGAMLVLAETVDGYRPSSEVVTDAPGTSAGRGLPSRTLH
jgi:FlaA1/EpsC-like NDP-sugar epimerase